MFHPKEKLNHQQQVILHTFSLSSRGLLYIFFVVRMLSLQRQHLTNYICSGVVSCKFLMILWTDEYGGPAHSMSSYLMPSGYEMDMYGDAPDKMTYTEQANKRSHCKRLTR